MKLKDFLVDNIQQLNEDNEYAATKRDIKQMEMAASKIVKTMEKLNSQFKKAHGVNTGNSVLYDTYKDWEQLTREVSRAYGGWFGFVKDSDYIK
jgi:DNA-binding GntR family transcriptional regulator